MQRLLKDNLITLLKVIPLPNNIPYPHWYDGSKFFQYHCVPSHGIERCYHLRHILQDHINNGPIKIGDRKNKSKNLVDKTSNELRDLFPLHSSNFIGTSDSVLDD